MKTIPHSLITAIVVLAVGHSAPAQVLVIDTANGNSPATFSSGTQTLDSLIVGSTNAGHVTHSGTATLNVGVPGPVLNDQLILGFNSGSTGTYALSAGTINISSAALAVIGDHGTGQLTMTGGRINMADSPNPFDFFVGGFGTGQIDISGGTIDVQGGTDLRVGFGASSTGAMNISGTGFVTTDSLFIGDQGGSTGKVTLSGNGGLEVRGSEFVGNAGSGTFTQTGGSHTCYGPLKLGDGGGTGTYQMNGGSLSVGVLEMNASSSFIQNGGQAQITSFFHPTLNGDFPGNFTLNGGTLTTNRIRTGVFNWNGGTLVILPGTVLGVPPHIEAADLNIAPAVDFTFDTTASDFKIRGDINLNSTSAPALTKNGSGTLTLANGAVGNNMSQLIVNGGTLQLQGSSSGSSYILGTETKVEINNGAILDLGGTGQYCSEVDLNDGTLQNGTVSIAGYVVKNGVINAGISGTFLRKSGAGTVTLNGDNGFFSGFASYGTFIDQGILVLGSAGALDNFDDDYPSAIRFGGGTLRYTASNTNDYSARIKTSSAAVAIDTNGQNVTFASSLDNTNTGGLRKLGTGMLTLAAANSYTGGTFLNAGTLRLDNAGALGASGPITFAGGTLQYTASNTTDYSARILNSSGFVSIDTNGQNVTFASAIGSSNTGGLFKVGAGTLALASTNGYTGSFTRVTGGTLAISGTINGTTIVSANATLRGSGTLTGGLTVQNGGQVTSNSGTMAVTAPVSIATTGVIRFTGGATFDASGATSLSNSGLIDVITGHLLLPATYSGAGTILTREVVKIKTYAKAGATVNVQIDSHTGHIYHLQKTTNLTQPFVDVGAPQNGVTGTTLNFTDPNATEPSAFYRFEVE